jgi:hypothetical protein
MEHAALKSLKRKSISANTRRLDNMSIIRSSLKDFLLIRIFTPVFNIITLGKEYFGFNSFLNLLHCLNQGPCYSTWQ